MRNLPTISGGMGPNFVRHSGTVAPLLRDDLDTEVIAPREDNLGVGSPSTPRAFATLRSLPDGSEDPSFIFNRGPYRGSSILVAGEDFGIGDAPERAIARLRTMGIRVVIAKSFGPAFYERCFSVGLLAVTLEPELVRLIVDQASSNPGMEWTVDLEREEISRDGTGPIAFRIHPRLRKKLLLGLSDLDEMRQHREAARRLREENRKSLPWLYEGLGGDSS